MTSKNTNKKNDSKILNEIMNSLKIKSDQTLFEYFLLEFNLMQPHIKLKTLQFIEYDDKNTNYWIYLSAFDNKLRKKNTIKIQIIKDSNFEKQEYLSLQRDCQNLLRQDLVITIYESILFEHKQKYLFFVVIQDRIYKSYKQYCEEYQSFPEFQSIRKKIQTYLQKKIQFKDHINKLYPEQFYLIEDENTQTITLKLDLFNLRYFKSYHHVFRLYEIDQERYFHQVQSYFKRNQLVNCCFKFQNNDMKDSLDHQEISLLNSPEERLNQHFQINTTSQLKDKYYQLDQTSILNNQKEDQKKDGQLLFNERLSSSQSQSEIQEENQLNKCLRLDLNSYLTNFKGVDFIEAIQKHYPQILNDHSLKIFEMIILDYPYSEFELDEYSQDKFSILLQKQSSQYYLIIAIKNQDIQEINQIIKLCQNFQQFKDETNSSIISQFGNFKKVLIENQYYLIYELRCINKQSDYLQQEKNIETQPRICNSIRVFNIKSKQNENKNKKEQKDQIQKEFMRQNQEEQKQNILIDQRHQIVSQQLQLGSLSLQQQIYSFNQLMIQFRTIYNFNQFNYLNFNRKSGDSDVYLSFLLKLLENIEIISKTIKLFNLEDIFLVIQNDEQIQNNLKLIASPIKENNQQYLSKSMLENFIFEIKRITHLFSMFDEKNLVTQVSLYQKNLDLSSLEESKKRKSIENNLKMICKDIEKIINLNRIHKNYWFQINSSSKISNIQMRMEFDKVNMTRQISKQEAQKMLEIGCNKIGYYFIKSYLGIQVSSQTQSLTIFNDYGKQFGDNQNLCFKKSINITFRNLQNLEIKLDFHLFDIFDFTSLYTLQKLQMIEIHCKNQFDYSKININQVRSLFQLFKINQNFKQINIPLYNAINLNVNQTFEKILENLKFMDNIPLNKDQNKVKYTIVEGSDIKDAKLINLIDQTIRIVQKYEILFCTIQKESKDLNNTNYEFIFTVIGNKDFEELVITIDYILNSEIESLKCSQKQRLLCPCGKQKYTEFSIQKMEKIIQNWYFTEHCSRQMKQYYGITEETLCKHDDNNTIYRNLYSNQPKIEIMNLYLQYCEFVLFKMQSTKSYFGITKNTFPYLHQIILQIDDESSTRGFINQNTLNFYQAIIKNFSNHQYIYSISIQQKSIFTNNIVQSFKKINRLVKVDIQDLIRYNKYYDD